MSAYNNPPTPPVEEPPPCDRKRVLVVEDSQITQMIIRDALEAAGLLVDAAEDGGSALQLAAASRYDLILMDLQLPVLDGLEAASTLRKQGYSGPIIGLASNLNLCLSAGMNAVIPKPIDQVVLLSTLRKWLAHGHGSRPDGHHGPLCAPLEGKDKIDMGMVLARAGGKGDLAERMVRSFVSQFGEVGMTLRSHMEQGEYDQARRTTHLLKGAADTLGTRRLAALAATLETALLQRRLDAVPALLADVDIVVHQIIKESPATQ